MLSILIARSPSAKRCTAAWVHRIHNARQPPRPDRRQTPRPKLSRQCQPASSHPSLDGQAEDNDIRQDFAPISTPSLVEQLFPEEEAKRKQEIELGQGGELPRQTIMNDVKLISSNSNLNEVINWRTRVSLGQEETEHQNGTGAAVVVLANAGKSLLDEDFRRLMPQGKHIRGWSLQRGDITQIIPGRDPNTLAFAGYYYIVFSSALSASAYRANAAQTQRLVARYSPKSLFSPIAPPPGYLVDGMDAHAAMQSYTFGPPTESPSVKTLLPPFSPLVHTLICQGGYPGFADREDKMPFEARLTLEGPQLSLPIILQVITEDARERGITWISDTEIAPRAGEWIPSEANAPSPKRRSDVAAKWVERSQNHGFSQGFVPAENDDADFAEPEHVLSDDFTNEAQHYRSQKIYILGFTAERMLQSFVSYWHRRPIVHNSHRTGSSPELTRSPIANVEVLW